LKLGRQWLENFLFEICAIAQRMLRKPIHPHHTANTLKNVVYDHVGLLSSFDLIQIWVCVQINSGFIARHNIRKSDSRLCFQVLVKGRRYLDMFLTKLLRQHVRGILEMLVFQLSQNFQSMRHRTFRDP
jgi:hypothetical protein